MTVKQDQRLQTQRDSGMMAAMPPSTIGNDCGTRPMCVLAVGITPRRELGTAVIGCPGGVDGASLDATVAALAADQVLSSQAVDEMPIPSR